MKLTEPAGLQLHISGGNGLGDWEVGRINLVEDSAVTGNWFGLMIEGVINVGRVASEFAVRSVDVEIRGRGAVQDVGILGRD